MLLGDLRPNPGGLSWLIPDLPDCQLVTFLALHVDSQPVLGKHT